MDAIDRKKISVITSYAIESFSEKDWFTFGQITGKLKEVTDHPRLIRSLGFGDDDYDYCAAEVIDSILTSDVDLIRFVIDHFDIDLWYQQKHPEKFYRVFVESATASADFWVDGYLKVFVSHLSANRIKMSAMKASLACWGVSAFIAHEDIEASREWRDEVEAGLETMEVLVAVVEPGFKDSDWCTQEVGFALGRKVDIIPLRAGLDPFGFFGKYQGIQVKKRYPEDVSRDIVQLLLKKPKHRAKLLQSIGKAFPKLHSDKKIELIETLDSWSVTTNEELRAVLEQSALSDTEKKAINPIIERVKAFEPIQLKHTAVHELDEEIPF